MSYVLKTNLSNRQNYGGTRSTSSIKYIVIHYTAVDGDHDENNAAYSHRTVLKVSAHYYVDDDSITQSVPDNYIAWAVGGSRYNDYKTTGGAKYYLKCTNANSISIELCDTNKNGIFYPTPATIANAVEFTKVLMKKYNIPAENVIRHFDVTGKYCPAYWCKSTTNNNLWKTEFWNKLTEPAYDWSKVFNYTYYTKRYSDLAKMTKDQALNHFLTFGMTEQRQAIAEFNVKVYHDSNPDLVAAFGDNWPEYYKHYIRCGYKENRKTV